MPIDHGVVIVKFGITECKKVKIHFQHRNCKTITVINQKLGADTHFKSSMILQWASAIASIDFAPPL